MRAAQIASAVYKGQLKNPLGAQDLMLFPEDRLELPDDVSDEEAAMMLTLLRNKGD